MNSKKKMLGALRLESPGVLPVAPCYLSLYLEPYRRRYYLEQYRRRMKSRDRYQIVHEEDVQFRANALYQSYGILEDPGDWMEISYGATRGWAERTEIRVIEDVYYLVDMETGEQRDLAECDEAMSPISMLHLYGLEQHGAGENVWDDTSKFKTKVDVDAVIPLLTAEQLSATGAFDFTRQIADDYGESMFLHCIGPAPYWSTYLLVGFQGMMTMVYDNPGLLRYMMDRKIDQWVEVYKAMAASGVNGVWIEEAFASADLISPETYDEFVFPYTKRMVDAAWQAGLLPILCFVGHMVPRLDSVRKLGVAALAPENGHKDWDNPVDQIVDELGQDVCIFGNVDPVRFGLEGAAEDIEAEVKRQISAGRRGRGFVVSMGSPFPLETNPRNIDSFVAAGRKHGRA